MKNILSRLFANTGKQIQKEHLSSSKEYNSGTHLIARCLGCGDKYRTFETTKQTNLLKMDLSKIFENCSYPQCLKANICLDLGNSFRTFKQVVSKLDSSSKMQLIMSNPFITNQTCFLGMQ